MSPRFLCRPPSTSSTSNRRHAPHHAPEQESALPLANAFALPTLLARRASRAPLASLALSANPAPQVATSVTKASQGAAAAFQRRSATQIQGSAIVSMACAAPMGAAHVTTAGSTRAMARSVLVVLQASFSRLPGTAGCANSVASSALTPRVRVTLAALDSLSTSMTVRSATL